MDGMTLNAEQIGVWRWGIASRQLLTGEAAAQGHQDEAPARLTALALSPVSIQPGEAPFAPAGNPRNAGGRS
jgi:hypothetical protein